MYHLCENLKFNNGQIKYKWSLLRIVFRMQRYLYFAFEYLIIIYHCLGLRSVVRSDSHPECACHATPIYLWHRYCFMAGGHSKIWMMHLKNKKKKTKKTLRPACDRIFILFVTCLFVIHDNTLISYAIDHVQQI